MNARAQSNRGRQRSSPWFFWPSCSGWQRSSSTSDRGIAPTAARSRPPTPRPWRARRHFPTTRARRPASPRAMRARTAAVSTTSRSPAPTERTTRSRSTVKKSAPGIFSKLFGVNSVNVGSKATARTALIASAKYVAPIVVKNTHPKLLGTPGCPCFGQKGSNTERHDDSAEPKRRAGRLRPAEPRRIQRRNERREPRELDAERLRRLPRHRRVLQRPRRQVGRLAFARRARPLRIGTTLLFPVYDQIIGTGSNAQYHVIGWVGFHLLSYDARGSSGSITGYFTEVIWTGLQIHWRLRPTAELRRTFSPANRLVLEQRKTR